MSELESLMDAKFQDDSCANYVGWVLQCQNFALIVSRTHPARAGLYDVVIAPKGWNSASDPWNERPDAFHGLLESAGERRAKTLVLALVGSQE